MLEKTNHLLSIHCHLGDRTMAGHEEVYDLLTGEEIICWAQNIFSVWVNNHRFLLVDHQVITFFADPTVDQLLQ